MVCCPGTGLTAAHRFEIRRLSRMTIETRIQAYEDRHRDGVIRVLGYLWGDDFQRNKAYFDWKYLQNPHATGWPGVVAMAGGEVVGFRGYFPARVKVNGRHHAVVQPGDTCVHPRHRRTGLSVAMGRMATEMFAPNYDLFLNFSCTKPSLPGYQRLGFHELAPKYFVTRSSILGLTRYVLASKGLLGDRSGVPQSRNPGVVTMTSQAQPAAMIELVRRTAIPNGKIVLARDHTFFSWRFRSPRHRYLFVYVTADHDLQAYVVFGLSANGRRAYILDHAQVNRGSLKTAIEAIISVRHFDVISMLGFGVDVDMGAVLQSAGFTAHSLVRAIEKRMHGELPVLVRPLRSTSGTDGFLLAGLDVRRAESWSLKPLISDAS